MKKIIKAAFRQQALYLPVPERTATSNESDREAFVFVKNLSVLGYSVSESLLLALKSTSPGYMELLYEVVCDVKGVKKNWTPLVKGWDKPTGETRIDHIATWVANVFKWNVGPKLPCGHIIPEGTFPLERYNGCPFCGTPFKFEVLLLKNQGSSKQVLDVWTEKEANDFFERLVAI